MASKFPTLTGTRAQQVSEIAAWINANSSPASLGIGINPGIGVEISLGTQFTEFANAHPTVTAVQAYEGWILSKVGSALPAAITSGISSGASDVGKAATAAAGGIGQVAKTVSPIAGIGSWEQALEDLVTFPEAIVKWISNRQNIFRVVKVIAGTALILIGINKISAVQSVTSTVTSTVKKAAETAALA